LSVTASFLQRHGAAISQRYLASVHFQALRDAKQLNMCAAEAGLDPVSEKETNNIEKRCAALEAGFGKEMRREYGWAAHALAKAKVNFADLEAACELGHWRPYYKWACQHNHAGYHPPFSMLGAAESVEEVFIVGPNNSGLAEPIELTAASMITVTGALLLIRPSLDHLVIMRILSEFRDQIAPLADKLERETWLAATGRAKVTRRGVSELQDQAQE
jgi:Family of unknown function (DUF5677)